MHAAQIHAHYFTIGFDNLQLRFEIHTLHNSPMAVPENAVQVTGLKASPDNHSPSSLADRRISCNRENKEGLARELLGVGQSWVMDPPHLGVTASPFFIAVASQAPVYGQN
jgi:hypothetical protein